MRIRVKMLEWVREDRFGGQISAKGVGGFYSIHFDPDAFEPRWLLHSPDMEVNARIAYPTRLKAMLEANRHHGASVRQLLEFI